MHTYRDRLRLEGGTLAALGTIAAAALLLTVEAARERPESTVGQLCVVGALLLIIGPRFVSAWALHAEEEPIEDAGDGEPTPLWHLPLVVVAIAAPFALLGAWDAVVRVCGGAALVGLFQATLLERAAAQAEAGRPGDDVLVRLPGSRLARGTRLGWVGAARARRR